MIIGIYRLNLPKLPKLKYLKLTLQDSTSNFTELKELLNKCQALDGLVFEVEEMIDVDWSGLFQILTESSPVNLFKFKIWAIEFTEPDYESFELFFENWTNRKQMILKTQFDDSIEEELIEQYKLEGNIKYYENSWNDFEDFGWVLS